MDAKILSDKVIFITGAAGRLGRAAARLFLEKGAVVVASDIIPVQQSAHLSKLKDTYSDGRFCYMTVDVSEEEQVQGVYSEIGQRFGKLDGVFHNAYKQAVKPTAELPLEEWNAAIKVSLTGAFLVCKHAITSMMQCGGGAIVNTSSVLSHVAKERNAAYGASKAGINQLTRVIAREYGRHGIRANVILPGDFKSEEDLERLGPERAKAFNEKFLLGRTGNPEEIAELAAYLLSDAAVYITGSLMTLDGGYTL